MDVLLSSSGGGTAGQLVAYVDVNGTVMEPTANVGAGTGERSPSCAAGNACVLSGHWWLDLDANPALIGEPLTVTLRGCDQQCGVPPCRSVDASMAARLQKK